MPGKVAYEARGAVGLIAVNPGKNPHWGISTTIWGTPDLRDLPRKPKIPVVAVNNPDGLGSSRGRPGGASHSPAREEGWWVADSGRDDPGTEEPDAFVLLHGHYDSWDVGVGDNAVGDATLLEVARVLWEHRADLRRACGSPGGRDTPPVATPGAPGSPITSPGSCTSTASPRSIATRPAAAGRPSTTTSPGWLRRRPLPVRHPRGDREGVARRAAVPGRRLLVQQHRDLLLLHAPLHDEGLASRGARLLRGRGMRRQHRLAHRGRPDPDRRPRGPGEGHQDLPRGGDGSGQRHRRARSTSARRCAPSGARSTSIRKRWARASISLPRARRSRRSTARWSEWRAHAAKAASLAVTDPAVQRLNRAIRRLARLLVPVNYTRGPAFFHDPAETTPSLPDLSVALSAPTMAADQRGFLRTHLTARAEPAGRRAARCPPGRDRGDGVTLRGRWPAAGAARTANRRCGCRPAALDRLRRRRAARRRLARRPPAGGTLRIPLINDPIFDPVIAPDLGSILPNKLLFPGPGPSGRAAATDSRPRRVVGHQRRRAARDVQAAPGRPMARRRARSAPKTSSSPSTRSSTSPRDRACGPTSPP